MTANEKVFVENVKRAVPDSKDNERVEKILAGFPGDATDPVVMDRRPKKASVLQNVCPTKSITKKNLRFNENNY